MGDKQLSGQDRPAYLGRWIACPIRLLGARHQGYVDSPSLPEDRNACRKLAHVGPDSMKVDLPRGLVCCPAVSQGAGGHSSGTGLAWATMLASRSLCGAAGTYVPTSYLNAHRPTNPRSRSHVRGAAQYSTDSSALTPVCTCCAVSALIYGRHDLESGQDHQPSRLMITYLSLVSRRARR